MKLSEYLKWLGRQRGECFFCNRKIESGGFWSGDWHLLVCLDCLPLLGRVIGDGVADCYCNSDMPVEDLERILEKTAKEAFFSLAHQLGLERRAEKGKSKAASRS